MDVFILVLLPVAGLFGLTRFLLDPKKNRFRQAQVRFAHDVMKGHLPARDVLASLANRDEHFDPCSVPDGFARRYGSSITCREAVRRALLEEQIRKQRRDSARKHQKLADKFKAAKVACALPWKRAAKGANVLGGIRIPSLEKALTGDVLSILKAFSATSQGATGDLGRIWQALMVYVGMRAGSLQECESQIADAAETALRVPQTIGFMHSIDRLLDTHCTPQLASAFVEIVSAAARCCTDSAVAESLTTEYDYLLEPFLNERAASNWADQASGTDLSEPTPCKQCAEAYQLLELPFGVPGDEVLNARKELAKSFHPDAFGAKRGARLAEEQLKQVNAACDHLLSCHSSSTRIS